MREHVSQTLFVKNCRLWEGPTLKKITKDCIKWEGPYAGAGEECEEEGAAERKSYELVITPIPLHVSRAGSRRIGSEVQPGKEERVEVGWF